MIKIEYDNNFDIICRGIIDLGFLGTFTEQIIEIQGKFDRFDLQRMSEEDRKNELGNLNIQYNKFLLDIEKNMDNIKNEFIIWIFSYLTDSYFEFWEVSYNETEIFINSQFMPEIKNVETVYSQIKDKNYSEVFNEEINSINGENIFKKYLPMINIEKLLNTIIPTFVVVNEYGLDFEINSNVCDGELFSSTVGTINKEMHLEIIDN
ncbi:hypothetical protein FDF11_06890 [Clostridium botulinum]|nr:hypothetical protein [Clostridium botulinum]NFR15346.1 hypothetical protein [Clostridium botulinum]NFR45064.1 hypothetical protein [Clostridium botulinum]NFS50409.1 hypothetical protein [Clostridium botulinum]